MDRTDWRGLCEELVQLDTEQPSEYADWKQRWKAATKRARAALAQPEPEADGPAVPEGREPASITPEPSDEELLSIAADYFVPVIVHYAHAVLARYGHQPAPAAEGEVAELVARLRDRQTVPLLEERDRAADLLGQRHPAPVPVSERLPEPEDCNGDREVWAWRRFDSERDMDDGDFWCLTFCEWLEDEDYGYTHWLPATALPLPSVEVQ